MFKITSKFTGKKVIELFADEDKKVTADLAADLIANTPVDSGALRNAWDIDLDNCTISNNQPYALKVMEHGHSKQAPRGTLTDLIDKYTRK